jgi:hypothetical protein
MGLKRFDGTARTEHPFIAKLGSFRAGQGAACATGPGTGGIRRGKKQDDAGGVAFARPKRG